MKQTPWKVAGLVTGLVAFLLLGLVPSALHHYGEYGSRPAWAAGVGSMMAIFWLTEALPIHVTALVPLLAWPLLGVFGDGLGGDLKQTVLPYGDPTIWLFMGGMAIAGAMQHWNLHRRIALRVMRAIGTDPRRLLLGVIVATAFISLWISNTATATMMVPIGIAMVAQFERSAGGKLVDYGAAIMLAIAYASNIGGIGTKIGTAPNAMFCSFMRREVGVEIDFWQFLVIGLPFVAAMIPITWVVLWRVGRRDASRVSHGAEVVASELAGLGPVKPAEKVILAVFVLACLLWAVSKPLVDALRTSWTSSQFEGAVSIGCALLLMLLRAGGPVLPLRALRGLPWETLILLGGSLSMAAGIQGSGLSGWMGSQLGGLRDLAPMTQLLAVSVATVALTAVASNMATITVMMTVLKGAVAPAQLTTVLFTSTVAASCDFALPAGTPPNAIVFGSGHVTVPRMAKTGVLLDLIAAILAALWCYVIVKVVV